MMNEVVERLMALSDTQLLDALQNSIQAERQSTAALVAHIAEVDARRLYLERAKPSIFSYCVDVLKLSDPDYEHFAAMLDDEGNVQTLTKEQMKEKYQTKKRAPELQATL